MDILSSPRYFDSIADLMSGYGRFSELTREFSAERLRRINTESERRNAEIPAANPKLADPEYLKDRTDPIIDAWDTGDRTEAEMLINGG